jgi:IPT/TIG domain
MKTSYVFRFVIACFCTLLLSSSAFAQSFQLNGAATSCTSANIVPTNSGVNVQASPIGCIVVGNPGGGTNATLSSVSPSCANAGSAITVNGQNLAGATSVVVGGQTVPSPFTSISATAIQLTVPANATAGAGTLTVNTPVGSPTIGFQVGNCVAPTITLVALSTAPTVAVTSAPGGSKVTLTGTAFTGASVSVGGSPVTITAGGTATQIEITLPSAASTSGIAVTNAIGSVTAPFTVTAVVGGVEANIRGTPLPDPSKVPYVIPSSGDNGAGVNAWEMDAVARCGNATPAVTKNWQHNIDLATYRAYQTTDEIIMGGGQTLSYRFKAPADARSLISFNETTFTAFRPSMMSISTKPCDFDVSKLQAATRDYCYVNSSTLNAVYYHVTTGPTSAPFCKLAPDQVYYLNVRFLNVGGTPTDSCTGGSCGGILTFR